jgi:polyphosphate kinase
MELRARFDESNNIEWANRLEEAGCRIIYGLVGYKVHSKICLITRKESGTLSFITQVGTGNYNEKTARLYTDLSLVTANQEIGLDASAFFSNMLIGNLEGDYKHLWVAPNSFKSKVLEHIEDERQKALSGGYGKIILKCNSLTDKEVIEKLAEASKCGVVIHMNVRGICCLLPQLPGITENIRVVSVVGKFLEHTRIFCFGEGADMKLYISSADLMTRNTVRRVEVACPILDPDIKEKVLWMLEVLLEDDTNAWELFSDGRYILRSCKDEDDPKSSQEIFIKEAQSRAIQSLPENTGQSDSSDDSSALTRLTKRITRLFNLSS